MINWLLGFLPAPIRYGLMAVGVVCYLVALIKPGSALAGFCMFIAGVTGATTLFSAATASIKQGQRLAALSEAPTPKPVEPPVSDPGVSSGVTDQSTAGHTQQAADDYLDSINKP